MTTPQEYAKETLWAIASKGVAFVFYYGMIYYLTRSMGVATWGEWSAFLALLTIVMLVSDQGVNSAIKRYISIARGTSELGGVVRVTFALRVVLSFLYTLAIALTMRPLLSMLNQPEYLELMYRSLLLICLYGMMEYFKNLFEALHRLRFTFTVNSLEHGFKLLFIVVLFNGEGSFIDIVISFTLAVAVALLGGIWCAVRTIPGIFTCPARKGLMRDVYLYSVPVFLMSIGGYISLEVDTIMLKSLQTSYETGIYAAAKQIIVFLPHLSLAISMGMIPGLALFDDDTVHSHRKVYYHVLGGVLGVYALICISLVGFVRWGMPIFFEPEYQPASSPLLMLIPFVVFSAVSIFSGSLLHYRGLAWIRSLSMVFTIVANFLLNWWWIPKWGAVGAAAASSLAYAPFCGLVLWQAHRAFAVKSAN